MGVVTGLSAGGKPQWLCKCDCGNSKTVLQVNLISKKSSPNQSCGCWRKESITERNKTHQMAGTRIYKTWQGMLARCGNTTNKDTKNYRDRGISVCTEWARFEAFYAWAIKNGYSDDLTIDRKNNDGNYEPSNCRWATRTIQQNNRRTNKVIAYDGSEMTIAQWAVSTGIPEDTLRKRLCDSGWAVNDALSTPVRKYVKHEL